MEQNEAWGILTSMPEADLEAVHTLIQSYGSMFPGIVVGVISQKRFDRQRVDRVLAEEVNVADNPSEHS